MTTLNTRTDPHRPSAFQPEDYRWVAYEDSGTSEWPGIVDGRIPDGVRVNFIHPRGCDMCGHRPLRHRYYYQHIPTGDVIVLGWDCSTKTGFDSREAMLAAKRVAKQREREATEQFQRAWEKDHGDVANFLTGVYESAVRVGRISDFLLDLRSKLIQYGYLTERQTAAVEKIMARQAEFDAKRKESEPDAKPIPEQLHGERAEIRGEVLSVKWKDDARFGGSYKMLVRDERGFKVWGTTPKGIAPEVDLDLDELKGAKVSFVATIEPSKDDPTFGFFKRPKTPQLL